MGFSSWVVTPISEGAVDSNGDQLGSYVSFALSANGAIEDAAKAWGVSPYTLQADPYGTVGAGPDDIKQAAKNAAEQQAIAERFGK